MTKAETKTERTIKNEQSRERRHWTQETEQRQTKQQNQIHTTQETNE
jgi:hypothetical protein